MSDDSTARSPASTKLATLFRRGSLRRRFMLSSILTILIIAIFAVNSGIYVSHYQDDNALKLSKRNRAELIISSTRSTLESLNSMFSQYLLSPTESVRQQWIRSSDRLQTMLFRLSISEWMVSQHKQAEIAVIKKMLIRYRNTALDIFRLRLDAEKIHPAFHYANNTMLPFNRDFVTSVNIAINETASMPATSNNRRILSELTEIRHLWVQKISNFRMYFINRMGSFSYQRMLEQEQSIKDYNKVIQAKLGELQKNSRGTGFETQNALDEMLKNTRLWAADFEKIRKINHGNNWRMDIVLFRKKLSPLISQIDQRLNKLSNDLSSSANDDVLIMGEMAQTTIQVLWGLSALIAVLLMLSFIYLDRSLFRPLKDLSLNMRNAASGKEMLPLPDVETEETHALVDAFSEMHRQIHTRQSALEYQAMHDSLTGLPNRSLLQDRLQQAIYSSRRKNASLTLMILDLNRFKEINDSLGHHIGDIILEMIGHRLKSVLRQSDTIARLGGDEFAILLPASDRKLATRVANKIHASLDEHFYIHGHKLYCGASIGIAIFPNDGDNTQTLMQHADVAMYHCKRNNMNFAFYHQEQQQHSASHLSLATDLRSALNTDKLELYFQPQVDFSNHKLIAAEALLRWHHPDIGMVPPDQIVPVAENTGMIHALTAFVVSKAIRQCGQWRQQGINLRISVNLSTLNLQDRQLANDIETLLNQHQVPPEFLTLEITESAIMSDIEQAITTLSQLHANGVNISIDDYGTGFSSLAYLKRLPVSELKIDKSFVMSMSQNENDAVIVKSTIELAHNLSLKVVAEGIETRAIFDILKEQGCDIAQGYFLGRPMPRENFESWMRHYNDSK